jgi:hypothetical protein
MDGLSETIPTEIYSYGFLTRPCAWFLVFGVGIGWEQDELLWAAAWLYVATGGDDYKAYISGHSGPAQTFFS